jgi:peptidase C39-like protein
VNGIMRGMAAGIIVGTAIFWVGQDMTIGDSTDPGPAPMVQALAKISADPKVYGNPLSGAKWWYAQTVGDCGVATTAVVVGEKTGKEPTDASAQKVAESLGAYTPGAGSNLFALPALYAHYGVSAAVGSHSLATVEDDLASGRAVVAAVNGATLWAADGFSDNIPGPTPDHVVVVDAVSSDYVVLTDTGINIPMARTETVTLATFKKAWSTSGYEVVVTTK